MASTVVAVQEKRRAISTGWMISQKDDLIWFIGSVVASYALLFANLKPVSYTHLRAHETL